MKDRFSRDRGPAVHTRATLAVVAGLLVLLPVGLGKSVASAGDDVMERLNILTGRAASDYRFVAPDNPALEAARGERHGIRGIPTGIFDKPQIPKIDLTRFVPGLERPWTLRDDYSVWNNGATLSPP